MNSCGLCRKEAESKEQLGDLFVTALPLVHHRAPLDRLLGPRQGLVAHSVLTRQLLSKCLLCLLDTLTPPLLGLFTALCLCLRIQTSGFMRSILTDAIL